jgi:hypothetical protein
MRGDPPEQAPRAEPALRLQERALKAKSARPESQRKTVPRLNRPERGLGAGGSALVHDVLIKGMNMGQVGQRRGLEGQR